MQRLLDFLVAVTRVWKGQDYAEVEWTAGPIPIEDGMGKEVVLRYSTNLSSGDSFLTDSNGRELLQRKLDFRPTWDLNVTEPVSGNYYPLTAAIAVQVSPRRLPWLGRRLILPAASAEKDSLPCLLLRACQSLVPALLSRAQKQ